MSVWQRLVALFRFDFRSAFASSSDSSQAVPIPRKGAAEVRVQETLPFELDLQKLDYIQYRRRILDWRDGFVVLMLAQGKYFLGRMAEAVEREADEVGIFRKLLAKPAAEVLEAHVTSLVRAPLLERVKAAEAELGRLVQGLPLARVLSLSLEVDEVDPSLFILGDLGFRTANRDKLLAKLDQLVLGERGIVDCYLRRAHAVSKSILDELDTKP